MNKIYVIIVTYNAMKWAEKCFSSIRKSSIPLCCIVIDNGSTDGTQDYIINHFPEVDFTQNEENLGFGKANNLGIEKAYKNGADFFYLMNQDAWLFENSLEKLLEVYENYPNKEEIGILSPMHLDGSESNLDLHFENYIAKYSIKNRFISELYLKHPKIFYEIDFVNAAHWFIPKNIIEKIGGFNPYFFHGAEDYDYANRIKYFNKKIIICTESKSIHDTHQTFVKPNYQNKLEQARKDSIRMQRETKYMNPAFDFNAKKEKKEFYSNVIKLALKGNIAESNFYREMFSYFNAKFIEIEKLRKESTRSKNPFLNLEN